MNCCDDYGQCKQGHGCPARETKMTHTTESLMELRKLADAATPIETDLYGDRYFQGPYSNAVLNKEQDAFFTAASPTKVIELLDDLEARDRRIAELEAEIADVKQVQFPEKLRRIADVWKKKCDTLRAELDALRGQEPVLKIVAHRNGVFPVWYSADWHRNQDWHGDSREVSLYAATVAPAAHVWSGDPSVQDYASTQPAQEPGIVADLNRTVQALQREEDGGWSPDAHSHLLRLATSINMLTEKASEPAPSTEGEQGERAEVAALLKTTSGCTAHDQEVIYRAAALLQSDAQPVVELTDEQIAKVFEAVASLHAVPVNGEHIVFSTLVGVAEGAEFARSILEAANKIGGHG